MTGFWSKIQFNGSKQPLSRENASMIYHELNACPNILLLGGNVPIYGIYEYEAYNFDLYKR